MNNIIEPDYYSTGANRQSAAADWSATSGLLAFGAAQDVAIWSPLSHDGQGIRGLLSGHSATITTVKFLSTVENNTVDLWVTGSANGEIILWKHRHSESTWTFVAKSSAHQGSVNAVGNLVGSAYFVTGGADSIVKLWKAAADDVYPLATLQLKPKFIPLAVTLGPFTSRRSGESAFLVVAGTRNDIQVYSLENISLNATAKLCATLTGHEAWIRSLSLTTSLEGGFLLASASQDKYVRIWRFVDGEADSANQTADQTTVPNGGLTAKVQTVSAYSSKYSITFEALLLGHEDWVYSSSWNAASKTPQLLTASADGSLSIWEPEPVSGIWISTSRLGEISGQKGATTATGSAGGFWTGVWAPDGKAVACLGRTGSWRLWQYSEKAQYWIQRPGVSGHIKSVNGISWSTEGSYLLSTGSDQTTRLHAEWRRGEKRSWHEFSRPQIHGYDINCIASTSSFQFSSGADEKLLRVFNEPKDIATMLHRLCGIPLPPEAVSLPETAAIPVLGLSNKAVDDAESDLNGTSESQELPAMNEGAPSLLDINEPPTEDLLARHTLWPEHEKLYGHGHEISEAATDLSGSVLATACKASSLDHAVIRMFDTNDWNEIKPPLYAHTLTVTRLVLSTEPQGYLLSVGRDRQWAVFKRKEGDTKAWTRAAINAKAHTRMILDAAWIPNASEPTFATAGRDKVVKIWSTTSNSTTTDVEFCLQSTIARQSAVTAISCKASPDNSRSYLAIGEDDGTLSVHVVDAKDPSKVLREIRSEKSLYPSKTVTRLAWRPGTPEQGRFQLAVASADGSLRILNMYAD